jgi:hypothetical protein
MSDIPWWLIICICVWFGLTWLLKKMWWVLAVIFFAILVIGLNSKPAPLTDEPDQPSAIMQWFIENTPER